MNRQEPGSSPGMHPENGRGAGGDGGGVEHYEGTTGRYADESVPGLFRKLATDVSTLFRQEVALARSEMTSAVSDVQSGITSIAMGGGVLYAGILFLLGGVMLLISQWVGLMWAAFIVGAVVTVIGLIMLAAGKKKMSAESMKPDRTVDSLRKDADLARRKVQ
ncbi:MAG TPA: phage holin family protein [Woeseiaceae bacterium]